MSRMWREDGKILGARRLRGSISLLTAAGQAGHGGDEHRLHSSVLLHRALCPFRRPLHFREHVHIRMQFAMGRAEAEMLLHRCCNATTVLLDVG